MIEFVSQPWPWYVAGPLIGLIVPLLLLFGGKQFGISANLRHMCAATLPANLDFLKYDWKKAGTWNLIFVLGILLGGLLATTLLASPDPMIDLAPATVTALRDLGIEDFSGLVPSDLFSWHGLASLPGLMLIIGGGFLVGFGARYAGGCTSGHAISGLANLQFPSLVAVLGFFMGGLFVTYVLLPILL
ncbi:MAG TPA: YeeE/YedE thiosulfate transporter family protein [Rhodothermales bacterium]|nr:YeeE/YedE thiosulfate transporter family protein [Rhodothermales bacterium]